MITRHGDFTQKQYLYKVYENGFNHKRKHYITADSDMNWDVEVIGSMYQISLFEADKGSVSVHTGGSGIYMDCVMATDKKRKAEIKNSDLSFKAGYEKGGGIGEPGYSTKGYIEVFGYKVEIDPDAETIEVFYCEDSLASDTLTSDYDFIRMYEKDGIFYIDNSDDRENWTSFASREITGNDETISVLKVFVHLGAAGPVMFGGGIDSIKWLRHDYGFKGVIDKVVDDLQFTTHINTPASSTTVRIKQSPLDLPEYIKNGAFVDIYVNYWSYLAYAQQGAINDENNEPIKDENNSPILGVFSEELMPEKDSWLRFSGYINSIDMDYDTETVTLGLVSHGEELDNILVVPDEKVDVTVMEQLSQNASDTITAGNYNRRQTFTINKMQKLSSIVLWVDGGAAIGSPASVELGKDNETISTATGIIYISSGECTFTFPSDVILEAGTYWIKPVSGIRWYYQNSDVYAGGSRQTLSGGVWSNTATDFYFRLQLKNYDIETTLAGTSVQIAQAVMDVLKRNYSQVTMGDVANVGYNLNLYLKMNTAKDALEKLGQMALYGWWWSVDPGTNEYKLQGPKSTADHVFYAGRDILTLKIKKDITNLVNDLYYVGGEINEAQKQLTIRTENDESIAKYRRGLSVKSDGRVYRYDTAQAFSDFEIMSNKDEVVTTDIEIQAKTYDIETIRVGDVVSIVNTGGERVMLQIAGVNYSPYKVKLSLANVPPILLRNIANTTKSLEQSLTQEANNAI